MMFTIPFYIQILLVLSVPLIAYSRSFLSMAFSIVLIYTWMIYELVNKTNEPPKSEDAIYKNIAELRRDIQALREHNASIGKRIDELSQSVVRRRN